MSETSSMQSSAAQQHPAILTPGGSPNISWPLDRPTSPASVIRPPANGAAPRTTSVPVALSRDLYPDGKRSLAGIAIRGFLLGTTLGACTLLSSILIYSGSPLWRPATFLALLSLFHFLEFYTTAAANTPAAVVSSYLLSNGAAYRIAHSAALLECTITSLFFPSYRAVFGHWLVILLGAVFVGVGQGVRSTAMIQAGESFNHQVQSTKKAGHALVTAGLYSYIRHPSYFGFFWWGLGSQMVLGNGICFCVYAGVLWTFFSKRIRSEERYLVSFFGDEYANYRARTSVLIPFIP